MQTKALRHARQQRVLEAALKWWEGKRPLAWSREEHLKHPEVNTTTMWESVLARACAEYIAAGLWEKAVVTVEGAR